MTSADEMTPPGLPRAARRGGEVDWPDYMASPFGGIRRGRGS